MLALRLLIPMLLAASGSGFAQEDPSTYLDWHTPGLTPAVFAPGLISTEREEGGVVVTPDGNEIYFYVIEKRDRRVTCAIYVTRREQGSWSEPAIVPFSGVYTDGYVALHPDGSRLYFQSNRPIDPTESAFEWNIWYVQREGDRWSEPRSMGRPINGRNHTGGPSVTLDGTMYFSIMELGGLQELYRSRLVDGVYQEPERLPDAVNARRQQCDSYVAPDESYLIFYALEGQGGHGATAGLYIAFRDVAGAWTEARKLGPAINAGGRIGSASIAPDGRFIFFPRENRARGGSMDVYWVDARIVDEMRLPAPGE